VTDINPVEFGKLIASVEGLTEKLDYANVKMDALSERIMSLESRYAYGKGALFGLALSAGFAVKGFWDTVKALM
jgi:hypothetical protein